MSASKRVRRLSWQISSDADGSPGSTPNVLLDCGDAAVANESAAEEIKRQKDGMNTVNSEQKTENGDTVTCGGQAGNEVDAPTGWTWSQKILIINMAAVELFATTCFSLLSPFFPSESIRKGMAPTVTGFVFGVFELTIFVTAPIFGRTITYTGAKFMYTSGLFLCGSCAVLFGFLDSSPNGATYVAMCFLVRIVEATGASLYITASFAIIAMNFPGQVATLFGLLETFGGLGMVIGPVIGGALYQLGGFRLPFMVLGACVLTACLVSYFTLSPTGQPDRATSSILLLLRQPSVAVVYLMTLCGAFVLGFIDPVLEPHVRSIDPGITPLLVGLVFLSGSAVYAASAPLWGWVADKTGRNRILMYCGPLIAACGFFLMGPAPFLPINRNSLVYTILGLVLMALGVGCGLIPTFPELIKVAHSLGMPHDFNTYGLVSGLMNSAFSMGAFLGPTAAGGLSESYGFPWACFIMSMVLIFASTLVTLLPLMDYLAAKRSRDQRALVPIQQPPPPTRAADVEATEKTPLLQ